MTPPPLALFFGAIGTLAETSEMQRESFNAAFRDAGLDWVWDRGTYREMLANPGGQARIAAYATARGEDVDAKAIHGLKVRHFMARAEEGLEPRTGVPEVIEAALAADIRVGFITTTGRWTVDVMRQGLNGKMDFNRFAFVSHGGMVEKGKPAPDIYQRALAEFGVAPDEALAIEDTPESADAAVAAGIPCIGYPGHAARDRAFPQEVRVLQSLKPSLLNLTRRDAA